MTMTQVTAAVAVAKRLTVDTSGAAARGNPPPPRVALLMARPDVASASDLAGKDIAIDSSPFATGARLRIALDRAGATGARLSRGRAKAVNRLLNGEVSAAVLALVSPDAAGSFPEVTGYRIVKVPLAR